MPSISEQRIRKAAAELVNYRWGNSDGGTASIAGKDMQEWQTGGSRVERAARNAVQKTKQGEARSERSQPQQVTATTRKPEGLASTALSNPQTSKMRQLEKEYEEVSKQWQQVDAERMEVFQSMKKAEASGNNTQLEQLKAKRRDLGALSHQLEARTGKLGNELRRLQQINVDT